jgi:putative acyl-CoA dehydrogenase
MTRVATSFDRSPYDPREAALRRVITPVAKYWVTKRAPAVVAEALECLGGNGYVEESILPRLYREAPLNSIWEGSGNVICLDVLRAMDREPDAVEAFVDEVAEAEGADRNLDAAIDRLRHDLAASTPPEAGARRLVAQLAMTIQGSLLVQFGASEVADAFCATRLTADHGGAFGTLPPELDHTAIARATIPSLL